MRYKLILEYDGTPFVGWQVQNNGVSVQQVLEKALLTCTKEQTLVYGTGRTDAGVHALDYVAHFDLKEECDSYKLCASLNALVRPYPIAIKKVERVSDDFHARFSARQRSYIYKIQNTRWPAVLNMNRVWQYSLPLNVDKMNEAASLLLGKHDFSTFRDSQCQAKSPVKTLDEIRLWREEDIIYMRVAARSFLHHQVRNIIGTLTLVGEGKWRIEEFHQALTACDRTKGGPTAPAAGLYFEKVIY